MNSDATTMNPSIIMLLNLDFNVVFIINSQSVFVFIYVRRNLSACLFKSVYPAYLAIYGAIVFKYVNSLSSDPSG